MTLDLTLDNIAPARAPLSAEVSRGLVEADLEALFLAPRPTRESGIKKLRDSHHALARCLASGMKLQEAAVSSGYTTATIRLLEADPTFQELVSFYRTSIQAEFADAHARMAMVTLDLVSLFQERLEESPESIDNNQILTAVKVFADRSGNGPVKTQVNANVDIAVRLDRARARRKEVIENLPDPPLTIEGTVNE